MILRLVVSELRHRPGRAAFLLAGYALGVAVMVVLLAVGEAMLEQARDRTLVGGGDVILLPSGISPEMLKAGGVGSLFLGLDHARFLQRQVLSSARAREEHGIVSASPVLDGKLVELWIGGDTVPALATGEIPSRARRVGAAAQVLAGRWEDSDADRRWVDPTAGELYREIDRFHLPPAAAAGDSAWAEWHYFNVMLDEERWLYLTLSVGGRVGVPGAWGGRVLLTVREPDGTHRSRTRDRVCASPACAEPLGASPVRVDTAGADLRLGPDAYLRQEGGVYRVVAEVGDARVDLEVVPAPGRYFPPTELGGGELVSGYVVPALLARASGQVCLPACRRVEAARAYHDHNWGVWRGVSWEWGAASSERLSLLYGVVRGDTAGGNGRRAPEVATGTGLFAYLVDDRGVRGLFRSAGLRVDGTRPVEVGGALVPVPRRMWFEDSRRGLRVEIEVRAAHVTDTGRARRRYFVQMRGVARVIGPGVEERLDGFFETYVDSTSGSGASGSRGSEVSLRTSSSTRIGEQGLAR